MPELLVQAAVADVKSKELTSQAVQIKASCHAQHGDTPSLVSCSECYGALLDAFRARYFGPISVHTTTAANTTTTTTTVADATTATADQTQPQSQPQPQQQPQQQPPPSKSHQQPPEWFTHRATFLTSLSTILDAAKTYQVAPSAVDDRVRAERAAWYAERVRAPLLRLLGGEEPAVREAVLGKVEGLGLGLASRGGAGGGGAAAEGSVAGGGVGGGKVEDAVVVAREIAEILGRGTVGGGGAAGGKDVRRRLAAVVAGQDGAGRSTAEVLRDAFFTAEDGVTVPEEYRRHVDMLQIQGLSMEQIVERILDERQAAAGAKEQADKLGQRLDELRRARAAHEAHKSRKAQRRESLAQQKVPDELYDLPPCAVCGQAPSPSEYICCSICTVLAGAGALKQQRVYCSAECEGKDHASHAQTHTCASGRNCTQATLQDGHATSTTDKGEDTVMEEAPPLPKDLRFCTECLTTLKQPTIWCSLACAEANFEAHSEELHPPARKKARLDDGDRDDPSRPMENEMDGSKRSPAKDISAITTSLSEAVREWEDKNRVRLEDPV